MNIIKEMFGLPIFALEVLMQIYFAEMMGYPIKEGHGWITARGNSIGIIQDELIPRGLVRKEGSCFLTTIKGVKMIPLILQESIKVVKESIKVIETEIAENRDEIKELRKKSLSSLVKSQDKKTSDKKIKALQQGISERQVKVKKLKLMINNIKYTNGGIGYVTNSHD